MKGLRGEGRARRPTFLLRGLDSTGPRVVLCLGAHADDIEIGCGGTIWRVLEAWPAVAVHWHVLSAPGTRRREARASAEEWLQGARAPTIRVHGFGESYFPGQWSAIKRRVEEIAAGCQPDLIFTHAREDRHQDHRMISDLTWNAFRDHTILEYEIPKYDGDLGHPNVYVELDELVCRRKVSALLRYFPTQSAKHWFTEDTFFSLLRLRGIECGPRARFAEAFYGRKVVL